jgi:sugar/nucleoside kinase (ribokinase family)
MPQCSLKNMHERGIPLFARDVQEPIAPLAEVVLLSSNAFPSAGEEEMSMAYELAHRWKNTVVIVRGAQGCIWCRVGAQAQRYEAPVVGEPDPLGGIGAVDVFRAGLLWSRLQEWNWEHSLRFASAALALKYQLPDGIPSLGQIEAIS